MNMEELFEILKVCPFGMFEIVSDNKIQWTGSPTKQEMVEKMSLFIGKVIAGMTMDYDLRISSWDIEGSTGRFEIYRPKHRFGVSEHVRNTETGGIGAVISSENGNITYLSPDNQVKETSEDELIPWHRGDYINQWRSHLSPGKIVKENRGYIGKVFAKSDTHSGWLVDTNEIGRLIYGETILFPPTKDEMDNFVLKEDPDQEADPEEAS